MFLVFLICLVRRLLECPLLVFYLKIRAKETPVNTRRMMPEMVFVVVLKFRVSCINAKPYREQGWEEKIAEHL